MRMIIKKIFSNKFIFTIIPITILNIIILLFQFMGILKEELHGWGIIFPFFNTIYIIIICTIFAFKDNKKYFIEHFVWMIISCVFAHLLALFNWCIWGGRLDIYNWKNLYFYIIVLISNLILLIFVSIIIQSILLVKEKTKKRKETNGT